jgi:hypothetical protein
VPIVVGRNYTLAGACAGTGTLRLAVRQDDGTVLRELSVPCSWPPGRHDVDLGPLDRKVYVWARYESAEPAQMAWSMIES